jgi:hypothetical protein
MPTPSREDAADIVLMGVERLAADPEFTARLLRLLERRGLARPEPGAIRRQRALAARRLLAGGMGTAETVKALQSRFGVSRATAYRDLAQC